MLYTSTVKILKLLVPNRNQIESSSYKFSYCVEANYVILIILVELTSTNVVHAMELVTTNNENNKVGRYN